jgi:HEAT repeat protein
MSSHRLVAAGIAALLFAAFTATPSRCADSEAGADEALVREAKLGTDGAALLAFFRDRSLTDADRERLIDLVRQLGSEDFKQREEASAALVARGPLAVPFLRQAVKSDDAEVVRRVRACLEEIDRGPGPSLPAAAVRLLVRRKPAGAVEALLRFAPHADDACVEDEVVAALAALGLHNGKADTALLEALRDKEPARRAVAAYAVARAADPAHRTAASRLLRDPEPAVRYRTALGMLAARDREALPTLVNLLLDAPPELAARAEDALIRLAGEQSPAVGSAAGNPAERKTWHAAWERWQREQGSKVDLGRLDGATPYLGFTLVPEMHGGKVWECDRSGKVRWEIKGLQQPRDACVLPNGRVLVCEVQANQVTERDLKGNIHWKHPVNDPAYVERLPNGNTFIGTHRRAIEVTPAGKEVFAYEPENDFFIHSMHRKPNGNVVCLSMRGLLREVDRSGHTVCSFQLDQNNRNWCGVQGLPGQRYLAVDLNQGHVLELDAKGGTRWECKVPGACYAVRRPTGNTLVCSFNGHRIVEVDRKGTIVWEKAVGSSPWRVHSR